MYNYLLALFCILISWCIFNYVRWKRSVFNLIEKINGPKFYHIIGTLYVFFGAKRTDIYKVMMKVTSQYTPFFKTWNGYTPEIHIIKPEHLEQIMNSSVQIKKSSVYDNLRQWLGDGLLLSDGAKWHQRRKLITPTFHFKILDSFMGIFQEKSKILVHHLEKECNGGTFNVYPYITHCALDIICETAMGVSVNAMTDRNNSYTKAVYSTGELFTNRVLTPLYQTRLYHWMPEGKIFQRNLNIMHDFTNKVISDRRRMLKDNPLSNVSQNIDDVMMSQKRRSSFLDLLLNAPGQLSDVDIREEVDTFMFEGHDTTTAAMCWSLLLLANHPDIQERVHEEVKSVIQDKKVPTSISELNEMRYLECCVKEALRLYPSVPIIGRTVVEDVVIDGYKIPKGTDCTLHIHDAHKNPEVYPEPQKFDPDRFLPANSSKRHPYAYVPFSAGSRNCIGQKFAMYEEKTVLASIIRSFKVLPIDTMESVNMVFEIVLKPANGINIALEKRVD